MPRLTSDDMMRQRLRSFDRKHLDSLYRMSRYLMGETWQTQTGSGSVVDGDDGYPVFGDITLTARKIGQSRRILNSALLCLSRYLSAEPSPQFPALDKTTGEVRKQFFLKRYRGSGRADGGWGRQLEGAFLDGDNLGYGVVQFGARRNPDTGLQYVHCEHVPATQVIWDEMESTLGRSTWVAVVNYVQPEVAEAMFSKEAVKSAIRTSYQSDGRSRTRYVRVTEYFDLGLSGGLSADELPTYAAWIGPWSGKPQRKMRMPYDVLPVAWMEHAVPPGMRRPIGKIELQLATTEAINELEARMRDAIKLHGIDFLDVSQVNKQDLEAIRSGKRIPFVRIENGSPDGRPIVQRVPAQEVASSLLQLLNLYERQYNADSQSTELSRGSALSTSRTASEVAMLSSSAQQQGIYTQRAVIAFYGRVVERSLAVAKVIDRDPCTIEIDGHAITIGDPADPRLDLAEILEESSPVIISPQSLEATDILRDQQIELQRLSYLTPYLNVPGGIPMGWFLTRMLKALGEEDPSEILGAQPDPMAAMMAGGQGNGMPTPEQIPNNLANESRGMATGGMSRIMGG